MARKIPVSGLPWKIVGMKPSESVAAFEEFVESDVGSFPELTLRIGVQQMLKFYEEIRPDGCNGPNGDMLLFQWGTYDWGQGMNFELDISRQFIEAEFVDDDAISQLSLTVRFPPSESTVSLGKGNRWCKGQAEVEGFRDFIFSNSAFLAVADMDPTSVSVNHSYV